MKRLFALLLVIIMLMCSVYAEESEIKITVNGYDVECDTAPVIKEGRTLLPVRAICQAVGASVSWDGAKSEVTVKGYDYKMVMQVGSTELLLYFDESDEPLTFTCEVAPEIIGGRVMLPLRAMCEALDFAVSWNNEERRVDVVQNIYPVKDNDGGVKIEKSLVKVHGRFAADGGLIYSSMSASGIEIRFKGTSLSLAVNNSAEGYIHVFVDGDEELSFEYTDDRRILLPKGEQKITLAENLSDGIHTVKVLKANEGIFNKIGWEKLYTDGEILPPPISKSRKIQIVGDSITCGSASLNFPENANGSSSGIKYEDALQSYASYVARAFDADAEFFSKSGLSMYNVIRNQQVPLYEKADPFANYNEQWDHTLFEPDLIIQFNWINEYVGKVQRDGVSINEIRKIYVQMLEMFRKDHPNAKLMLVSQSDQKEFIDMLKSAIRQFGLTNDASGITVMTYSPSVLVNSGHPHPEGHYNIAQAFIPQIEEFMGWKAN